MRKEVSCFERRIDFAEPVRPCTRLVIFQSPECVTLAGEPSYSSTLGREIHCRKISTPSQVSKVKPIDDFFSLVSALKELLTHELFRPHSSCLSLSSSFLLL